jgi:hypothetical protein
MLILTSSSGAQLSREEAVWQHGAFTKALLDTLSHFGNGHTHQPNVIKAGEFIDNLADHLDDLTDGHQSLGISNHNFKGALFAAGP